MSQEFNSLQSLPKILPVGTKIILTNGETFKISQYDFVKLDKVDKANNPPKNLCYYINKLVAFQRKQEDNLSLAKRYAMFPILDEENYAFYQKQEIQHWTATELDFTEDIASYDKIDPQQKKVFDTITIFFLSADGVVSNNIITRFMLECDTFEEQAMFISQLHIELIHAETYGLAAQTIKRDPDKLAELALEVNTTKCVQRKMDFMEKWMLGDYPRYQRLLAFACAEGIFFCNLFAIVFWFRSKGLFRNFIAANEAIAKDESLHRDYGVHLFLTELSKHSLTKENVYSEVEAIIEEALNVEDEFSEYILSEPMQDMTKEDLKVYARLIADNLLVQLGYSPKYKVKNPFTWLNDISLEQKSNFYEVKVMGYRKKSLGDVLNWKKRVGMVEEKSSMYDPNTVDF
jgi:ribonucleoside-diphosphate reductase subunit M2